MNAPLVKPNPSRSEAAQQDAAKEAPVQDETHEPPAVYVGVITPPRQQEVMKSPSYCPKPMQAQRSGSEDFTHLPSLRRGQRVPFTGSYMAMTGGE